MVKKLVFVAVLGLGLLVTQSVVSTTIQPEVATSLTLEQFADPSIEVDSTSRMIDSLSRFWPIGWLLYFGASALWLRKDIVSLYNKGKGQDESKTT